MLGDVASLLAKMNEEMPSMVKHHTDQIGHLDEEIRKETSSQKVKLLAFMKNQKSFTKEQKMKMFLEIKKSFDVLMEKSDEKVKLATDMYDNVDGYIKKMDDADKKFREQRALTTQKIEKELISVPTPTKKGNRKDRKRPSTAAAGHKAAHLAANEELMKEMQSMPHSLVTDMEMPIDPNEPVYCFCHTVSHGEMVACDNLNCPTEWFHFACVGLDKTPVGQWFCDSCKAQNSKKKK